VNVALLGGSFDPPHLAHQMACLYLLEGVGFEEVWLLPCSRHAFGKQLAPFEHRCHMCKLLAEPFGNRVCVLEIERELAEKNGSNRTVDTVAHLKASHPALSFTVIIGSDVVPTMSSWKNIELLKSMASFHVLLRPGHELVDERWSVSTRLFPNISSSEIRDRVARGDPAEGLVPLSVERYILEHGLYREESR
jgi:nicotinate-nucleotide adenylyltransferase